MNIIKDMKIEVKVVDSGIWMLIWLLWVLIFVLGGALGRINDSISRINDSIKENTEVLNFINLED